MGKLKIVFIAVAAIVVLSLAGVLAPGLLSGVLGILWTLVDILLVIVVIAGLVWLVKKILEDK